MDTKYPRDGGMRAADYYASISPNIMTPDRVACYDIDGLLVELSAGRGFSDEPLYGVSVVEPDPDGGHRPNLNLGGLFWSREDADVRIDHLRAGERNFESEDG